MLQLTHVTRRYGDVVALDGLDLTVPTGELFGFLGPNGAGKTTAMRTVFGISLPDEGEVTWRGKPIDRDTRRRFGYLPEERGLYAGMPVAEQLEYLGELHGMTRVDAGRAGRQWLDRLNLGDRADDKLETLSLGNQQRVQLAAALIHDPELLVLDEPFSGLDPVGVETMGAVLAEQAERGVTVLFSSHQLDLVEQYCRRVAIIDRGHLVVTGAVADLTATNPPVLELGTADPAGLPGVLAATRHGDHFRLVLEPGADPQAVLAAALARGPVTHFSFERRRLSEVFLTAVHA